MKQMDAVELRLAVNYLRFRAAGGKEITISCAFAAELADHLEADLPFNRERKSA